ncbi:hypothetical protein [Amycolatopsis sp. CA-230715]|uniref:hypothetical protein n=1 Tax=Amycolatopsis sp. CA-230715 TaxID=2745196 RepID=UPI001C00ADFC|nr:hypothetical protein [Amycolatopsis sp. CA-230715]QWF78684.1 hypothetical protein HUW46_02082 [Amycolatopsis sp. CA-230715]
MMTATDEPMPAETHRSIPKTEYEYSKRHAATYDDPDRLAVDLALWRVMQTRPGWSLGFPTPEVGDVWDFDSSFGGAQPEPSIGELLSDMGLVRLRAGVQPDSQLVRIGHCGVHMGCERHKAHELWKPLDSPDLSKALRDAEEAARTIDLDSLAGCLVWGDCGRNGMERIWWADFGRQDSVFAASPKVAPQKKYGEETEAMKGLAAAGFTLKSSAGPEATPETLTFVRRVGDKTDVVSLALNEGALSMAFRYPAGQDAASFEEASGEYGVMPEKNVAPDSITAVVREVLEWTRD